MNSQDARIRIAALEQHQAELASAHTALEDSIRYLTSRSQRLVYAATHRQDPAAQADKQKTDKDLADAQSDLADMDQRQAANGADLANARQLLEACITAELQLRHDQAERAGRAAWLKDREFQHAAELARQVFAQQRALTNATAAELQRRGQPGNQILEVPLQAADKVEGLYKNRLAELDAKLADPAQYDPARFPPKPAAPPQPVAQPRPAQPSTQSVDEFYKSFANAA